MHKWRTKKYSFVFVLIRPTSLVLKKLFFCILSVLTRLVWLISAKTKEHFFGRHLCIWSMGYIQGQTKVLFKLLTADALEFITLLIFIVLLMKLLRIKLTVDR